MTPAELVADTARRLDAAALSYGHGTGNAHDEAAWLVLHALGLPLDTDLLGHWATGHRVTPGQQAQVAALLRARIDTRRPLAYLTREAWLQGLPFYVDERAIVPRSLIAEVIADGGIDLWLRGPSAAPGRPKQAGTPLESSAAHDVAGVVAGFPSVLDLCTGNASLAVLAALTWPGARVDAADLSADALAVARINVDRHGLQEHITLIQSDGLAGCGGPYELILCNPPYVNAASMAALPPEYRAEPALALAGGADGMDFIRTLLRGAAAHMGEHGVLVLEIGHERAHFDAAFPQLEPVWLETSAGEDQVLLLTREALSLETAADRLPASPDSDEN